MFQAFILGLVQALGEFLPISSSGHLVLVRWLFGWGETGLTFDLALHAGTLVAVIAYFWKDIVQLPTAWLRSFSKKTRNFSKEPNQRIAWLILLASIPAAVIGLLFNGVIENKLRSPLLVAINLIVFGTLLLIADRASKQEKPLKEMNAFDALLMGVGQTLALMPGVSRSGGSMTFGLFRGMTREAVARFSFLMSVPVIAGAFIFKLPELANAEHYGQLAVGFLTAAFFGFLTIKFLMRYISNNNFTLFVWYRYVLAVVIIVLYFIK